MHGSPCWPLPCLTFIVVGFFFGGGGEKPCLSSNIGSILISDKKKCFVWALCSCALTLTSALGAVSPNALLFIGTWYFYVKLFWHEPEQFSAGILTGICILWVRPHLSARTGRTGGARMAGKEHR